MSSIGQPIQPGATGHSIEKATATTTSEVTQKQFVATGSAIGPACEVEAERAVGTAAVDTTFLGAKPDLSGVEASLNKVAASEAEVAAKQAAAQAALQQAGLLSAAAQEEALRAQQAKLEAARRIDETSAQAGAGLVQVQQQKEAEAMKNKVNAELAAKAASQAKAEEAATVEAARLAAQEAAEADAIAKAALAKKEEAALAAKQLEAKSLEAKELSAAETRHAADLAAASEARSREAALAGQQVSGIQSELTKVKQQLVGGVAAPVQTTTTSTSSAGGLAAPMGAMALGEKTVSSSSTSEQWYPMHAFAQGPTQPAAGAFPYVLNLRFSHAELKGLAAGVRLIAVRVLCNGIEARTDRLLDATRSEAWNLDGHIPLANPSADIIEVQLLDASRFSHLLPGGGIGGGMGGGLGGMRSGGIDSAVPGIGGAGVGSGISGAGVGSGISGGLPAGGAGGLSQNIAFNQELWSAAPVIGRAGLRVHTLMDGHLSRTNQLRFDSGVIVFASMQLRRAKGFTGSSGGAGSGVSGLSEYDYEWQQASGLGGAGGQQYWRAHQRSAF